MKFNLRKLALLLAVFMPMWAFAGVASAHHLWVVEKDGDYAVCRGHIGESMDPYDPSCVTDISALAADGSEVSITRTDEKNQAVFEAAQQPALVTVISAWGDRVNTTRGKKLMSREKAETEGLTVISAFTSTQYSKTLFAPSKVSTRTLGMKFELVPLVDPTVLATGRGLKIKLLFDGQPLEGVSVFTNHHQESTTDKNGVAEVVFEETGIQLLYAIHKIPAPEDSDLDFLKFMTFLTFEVKQ